MKIILVYNPESETERNKMELLENKLGTLLVAKYDFRDVRDILPVRATPAFIVIRDDMEGDELLDGDLELKIEAEVTKIMDDEDLKVHQKESNRLDHLITNKINAAQDALIEDMMGRGVI
jgi:hypothetical protein